MSSRCLARLIRLLRVGRLFRVVRIIRVVRLFRSLRTLVQSLVGTLKTLFWALLLLFLIMHPGQLGDIRDDVFFSTVRAPY